MDFDLTIELNPHSAPSYFNRGNLHYSLGNYSSAELDYKKGNQILCVCVCVCVCVCARACKQGNFCNTNDGDEAVKR